MDNGTEPNDSDTAEEPEPRTDAARLVAEHHGRHRSAERREEVVHRPHLLGPREQGEADAAGASPQRRT